MSNNKKKLLKSNEYKKKINPNNGLNNARLLNYSIVSPLLLYSLHVPKDLLIAKLDITKINFKDNIKFDKIYLNNLLKEKLNINKLNKILVDTCNNIIEKLNNKFIIYNQQIGINNNVKLQLKLLDKININQFNNIYNIDDFVSNLELNISFNNLTFNNKTLLKLSIKNDNIFNEPIIINLNLDNIDDFSKKIININKNYEGFYDSLKKYILYKYETLIIQIICQIIPLILNIYIINFIPTNKYDEINDYYKNKFINFENRKNILNIDNLICNNINDKSKIKKIINNENILKENKKKINNNNLLNEIDKNEIDKLQNEVEEKIVNITKNIIDKLNVNLSHLININNIVLDNKCSSENKNNIYFYLNNELNCVFLDLKQNKQIKQIINLFIILYILLNIFIFLIILIIILNKLLTFNPILGYIIYLLTSWILVLFTFIISVALLVLNNNKSIKNKIKTLVNQNLSNDENIEPFDYNLGSTSYVLCAGSFMLLFFKLFIWGRFVNKKKK